MTTYTAEEKAIKEYFIQERGYWRPWTETLLRQHPRFLKAYASYAGQPARQGPLSPRMVELIYVALDASSTHLFAPGLRTHMAKALEAGASAADILDVLHRVALQGLHCVYQGFEILADETGQECIAECPPDLRTAIDHAPAALRARLARVAQMDPHYAQAVLELVNVRPDQPGLSEQEHSLIDIALHACFSGFNATALRADIRAALAGGVDRADIMQAMVLGAHLSVHGTALGATVYAECTAEPAEPPSF